VPQVIGEGKGEVIWTYIQSTPNKGEPQPTNLTPLKASSNTSSLPSPLSTLYNFLKSPPRGEGADTLNFKPNKQELCCHFI